MNIEIYTHLLSGLVIPFPIRSVGESPVVFGVVFAILSLTLVILRRRAAHHENADFSVQESIFPTPPQTSSGLLLSKQEATNTHELQSLARELPALTIVSSKFAAEPHAYLRKLLAAEDMALQELVSRSNSLQLLIDSNAVEQNPICMEILRLSQQILKCASQRHSTAELLLDDAEAQSIDAARELLAQPLQLQTEFDSGVVVKIDPKNNWVQTVRSLLDDVERDLRIAAVG